MKCPNCLMEIADHALFCRYCGTSVAASEKGQDNTVTMEKGRARPHTAPEPKSSIKKKRVGLRILLVFSIITVIAGGVLGFLVARGVIVWKDLLPKHRFAWTDYSEGVTRIIEESDPVDGEEKEVPEPSDGQDTEAPQETVNTSPTETTEPTTSSGSSEEPTVIIEEHYAKHSGSTLLIIDDRAHVLSEQSIFSLLKEAKEFSTLSGYSVMIVLTNDLSDMPPGEFATEYYTNVLEDDEENSDLLKEVFLCLIDVTNKNCSVSTFETAESRFSDSQIAATLEIIQPHLDAEDFETALTGLLENAPR